MKNLFLFLGCIGFQWSMAQVDIPNTLSEADKIYGLSKFWQEVNYNFAYINKIDREVWENDYKRLISEVTETRNDYEYYQLLQKFCATLKDGHTNVVPPQSILKLIYTTEFGPYKIYLKNINGKTIVSRINASKKEEIPIGSELIQVNGLSTRDYGNQYVRPYLSSSTEHILEDYTAALLLASPKGTMYKLKLKKPNGEIIELEISHEDCTEKELFPPYEDKALLEFRWINPEVAYLSLNSFYDAKIDSLFISKLPEIKKAKKLIVDLRDNSGGMTGIGTNILKYLSPDEELYGSAYHSRLHIPTYKAWGKYTKAEDTVNVSEEDKRWNKQALLSFQDDYWHHFPYQTTKVELSKDERIVVPTVLLIGHNTASAAEDFLIAADNQKHMTKIGEPTFGSTGLAMFFDLPGGGLFRVCTKKDTYPDGREFVGYGIQPDILVEPSYQDFMEGRDPTLDKAVEYLMANK